MKTDPRCLLLRSCLLCALAWCGARTAEADVRLPAIFSDHAVLQQDAAVPVWGWAEPGEQVTVALAGQSQTVTAGADGKWSVKLDKLAAGGPHTLSIKAQNTIAVQDVFVGEVWLGSGQSNMAMTVNRAQDFEREQAAANWPQIRMFTERSVSAPATQEVGQGAWVVCTPESVGAFSATLYFFGREVHQALRRPVGLINSSVGGTPIEAWISPEAQQASAELRSFFQTAVKEQADFDEARVKARYERDLAQWQAAAKQARTAGKPAPRRPRDPLEVRTRKANVGGLFNGKIAPLIPYGIRGAVWYQGEANSMPAKAPFYQYQLPLLVQDWRARWGCDFPFAWVQLPNFDGPGRDWPTVREAMLKSLRVKDTGMAIAIDIGEAKDIHPRNKQEVGKRLALWARGAVYGQQVATSGPLPAGHEVRGSEIVLSFQHTDGGLVAKGGELRGFVIAGADKQWKPAQARIQGEQVLVSHPEIPHPIAVRYAWENNPTCNLYNAASLPASPFRTDDFPAAEEGN